MSEAGAIPATTTGVRAKRVVASGAWGGLSHVVALVSQLATVPLFLQAWGADLYGDWIALSALVAYLVLADAGMQQHAADRLTRTAARGDFGRLGREIASASAMYVGVLAVIALGTAGLAGYAGHAGWFAGRAIGPLVPAVLALLGLQVGANIASGFAAGLYRAMQRPDLGLFTNFLSKTLQLAGVLLVLRLGGGPVALAASQLAIAVAMFGAFSVDVARRDPRFRLQLAGAERAIAFSLVGPSLLFLLLALASSLSVQGVVLVLSKQLAAAEVVVFTTSRTLVNVLRQVVVVFVLALWADVARLQATGERERLRLAHGLLQRASMAVVVPGVALLAVSGPWLHAWWMNGRADTAPGLLALLAIDQLVTTPVYASSMVLAAMGRHRGPALLALVVGVLQVAGVFALAPRYGLVAAGAVVLAVDAVVQLAVVPYWVRTEIGEPVPRYWTRVVGATALLFALSLGVATAAWAALPAGWIALVLTGIAVAAVTLPAWWFLAVTSEERGFLTRSVGAVLARRRGKTAG